jgi:zinc protease
MVRIPRSRSSLALLIAATVGLSAGSVAAKATAPAKSGKSSKAAKTAAKKPSEPKFGPDGFATIEGEAVGVKLNVQHFKLDNGLRVYVVEDHSTPSFALQIAFNVGSRDEEKGRTGFAHVFEHMMFKGSDNVPEGGHFDYVLGAGGEVNAFTTADVTQYYEVMPSNYLERALWLEADRLTSLAVTDENFENQRQAVLEERAMRIENQPYSGPLLEFFAKMWEGTGYGHLTIGSKADLEAAQTSDVKAFFDKYYVPSNAAMAIVGDVDPDQVKSLVEKYFGPIPAGSPNVRKGKFDHTQKKMEERVEDPLAQQPMYVVGWKTVPSTHPDRYAMDILGRVLLDGQSSRLSKILVDEKKIALATVPMPQAASGGRDAGAAMAAFVPVAGKSFEDIEPIVLEEIDNVKKKGISAKDLQKALNNITVEKLSELATNNYRALMIAQGAILEDDPIDFLEDLDRYQKVTRQDVKRVANQYLTDKWVVLQIVPKK